MKLISLLPATLLLASTAHSVEISSTVAFTNDYRFHGVSQTAGDPAVQASIDGAFDNGLYLGVWGSNVDFGDDANLEVDYYIGYGNSLTEDLSYAATFFYFQYPGYDAFDIDYTELDLQLFYKEFSITYAFSSDYINSSEEGQYFAIDYSKPLTEQVNVDLHAGYSFGSYWENIDPVGKYSDYSAGISGSVAGLDLSAAYLFNKVDDGNEVNSGLFRNDNTLLLSVSRTF